MGFAPDSLLYSIIGLTGSSLDEATGIYNTDLNSVTMEPSSSFATKFTFPPKGSKGVKARVYLLFEIYSSFSIPIFMATLSH